MSGSDSVAAVEEKTVKSKRKKQQRTETEDSISSVGHEPKEHNRDTKLKAIRSKSLVVKYRRIRKMLAYRSAGVEPPPMYKRKRCEEYLKFKITTFKVPETRFEIPEDATIGSLESTVLDAVKCILSGELHLSVLLEGEKVRDKNRTLQQMRFSNNCDLGGLGFILEDRIIEASSSPIRREPPLSSASPITDVGCSNSSMYHDVETYIGNYVDKNQVSRVRRPFSESEVEALVEAVEIHGPRRWCEVKTRAFNDAEDRTCVDLKDKWKTLVHTASIPPRQRRGEPVPQHLLDRVLAAACT